MVAIFVPILFFEFATCKIMIFMTLANNFTQNIVFFQLFVFRTTNEKID